MAEPTVRIIWDPSGINPAIWSLACAGGAHDLCDGRSDLRRWFKRYDCGCDCHKGATPCPVCSVLVLPWYAEDHAMRHEGEA